MLSIMLIVMYFDEVLNYEVIGECIVMCFRPWITINCLTKLSVESVQQRLNVSNKK